MLGAGAIGVAAVAGVGAWSLRADRGGAVGARDVAFQARLAMDQDTPEGYARAVGLLRQATASQPDDAALWGKLALGLRALSDYAPAARTPDALQACELAAARALALDARQPDARVALTMLRPAYGDWLDVETKLRAILKDRPTEPRRPGQPRAGAEVGRAATRKPAPCRSRSRRARRCRRSRNTG